MTDQDIREKVSAIERDLEAVKLCLEDKAEQEANGALVQVADGDGSYSTVLDDTEIDRVIIEAWRPEPATGAFGILTPEATAALGVFQPVPERDIVPGDCVRYTDVNREEVGSVEAVSDYNATILIPSGRWTTHRDNLSLVAREDPAFIAPPVIKEPKCECVSEAEGETNWDCPLHGYDRDSTPPVIKEPNECIRFEWCKTCQESYEGPGPVADYHAGHAPVVKEPEDDDYDWVDRQTECGEPAIGTGDPCRRPAGHTGGCDEEPDPAPSVIKEPEPAQSEDMRPNTGTCCLAGSDTFPLPCPVHGPHEGGRSLLAAAIEKSMVHSEPDPAPSIPRGWDLITCGDGIHRARIPHPDRDGWGWRAPCAISEVLTTAEVLALGPVRRCVPVTLPDRDAPAVYGMRSRMDRRKVAIRDLAGTGATDVWPEDAKRYAAELLAAALAVESDHG